jgi:hypothetical protein
VWNEALVLRPDLSLALAWAIGLVALETARLHSWDTRRLAIGGFFLALATAVHYTGVLASAGVVVYAAWMWKELGVNAAKRRVLFMLGGASVVAVPYLVLFLIPHLRQVLDFALLVQRSAPPGSAFQRHLDGYAYWHQMASAAIHLRPVTTVATEPLLHLTIPAALVGPALLASLRSTRVLALAALPQLLFMLFGARHKQISYTGYFAPEITLYLVALLSVVLTAVFKPLDRLKSWWSGGAAVVVIIASSVVAFTEVPAVIEGKVTWIPGIYDLEAGRAAARKMLGPQAAVGTTSAGAWYTSGAAHLYFVTPDIIYPEDIRSVDLKQYFQSFDALAVDPHQSWAAYNSERVNITSSYTDGGLHLRGFYFADRRDMYQSYVSYMLYSTRRQTPLEGYALKGQTILRFREQPGGERVFVAAVCPTSDAERYGSLDNTELKLDHFAVFFRPVPSSEDPRQARDHSVPAAIITMIADRPRFERTIRPAMQRCTLRDEIAGDVTPLDLRQFIKESERTDQPIRIYRTYEEFRQAASRLPGHKDLQRFTDVPRLSYPRGAAPLSSMLSVPGMQLQSIALAYDKAKIVTTPVVRVTTAAQRWAYAASIPIDIDKTIEYRPIVHVRARVVKGQIGIGILDRQADAF